MSSGISVEFMRGAFLLKSATNGAWLKAESAEKLSGLAGSTGSTGSAGLSVGLPSIGSIGCKLSPKRSWLGRLIWF